MAFCVPEQYRITEGAGLYNSDSSYGNNGAFKVPRGSHLLRVIAGDGLGWEHVSVSLVNRCPTWAEMCFIKDLFWGPDDVVLQYHPSRSNYVNYHPFTLHLWRPVGQAYPVPPPALVGPRA